MIHSGHPAKEFIDTATRHVLLRQGVLGLKVKIMRGSDPEGKAGPQKTLPDSVTIIEPKEEQPILQPMSQDYGAKALASQQAVSRSVLPSSRQSRLRRVPLHLSLQRASRRSNLGFSFVFSIFSFFVYFPLEPLTKFPVSYLFLPNEIKTT